MKPSDLGLPGKFQDWRQNQLELAAKIAASSKYAFLLDSPTGTGKSLIAAAAQKLLGKNAVYLCSTKQLQDQILNDFPYAKTLKGRSNYVCLRYPKMFPTISAENCTHVKDIHECDRRNSCPYMIAKVAALRAPLAVLNTSYFLNEANYVGAFDDIDFLIIDEIDTLESQLMNFIQLSVTKRQLDKVNVTPPKFKTKFECWVEWANEMLRQLKPEFDRLVIATEKSDDWGGIDVSTLRRKSIIARLISKLSFFVREVDSTWVPFYGEEEWVFKPIWVAKYSSKALWDHAKKVLGMSATILDPRQLSLNTGLTYTGNRSYEYKALPSPFPKENRPVYFEPCADVTNKSMDVALPKLAVAIERILERHSSEKILVHVVSYKIRDYLMRNVRSNRLTTHNTSNRAEVLTKFKESRQPLVLVSPSMERGVDLPDEECRVVIIAKCLPEDAMVVTVDGPKRYSDIVPLKDKVFTLSQQGVIEIQPILRVYVEDYTGKLIRFDHSITPFSCTPDHRVRAVTRHGTLVYADALSIPANGSYHISHSGLWKGESRSRFYLDDVAELGKEQPGSYDAGDFLELLGWYIAEGHPRHTRADVNGYNSWKIVITQRSDSRREHIRRLCDRMGIKYVISMEKGREKNIVISGRRFYETVTRLVPGKSRDKRVPKDVLALEPTLLSRLFMGLMGGDGSMPDERTWSYVTTSEGLCWDFCELCIKLGYNPKVYHRLDVRSPHYEIYIRGKHNASLASKTSVSYSGKVWCITTTNGNFLAYQNGCFFFTGNCPYPDLSDPQISKRVHASKDGNSWYAHKTISSIIQMSGRAVRSVDDWAVTYILDEQFSRLFREWNNMFPQWYKEAVIM